MRVVLGLLVAVLLIIPKVEAQVKIPAGWKMSNHKSKDFTCWIPTAVAKHKEDVVDKSPLKGVDLKFTTMSYEPRGGGPVFEAGTIGIMGDWSKLKPAERIAKLKALFVADLKGKAVGMEANVKQGKVAGKEFYVQTKTGYTRYRIYAADDMVWFASSTGTQKDVQGEKTTTFLNLFKIPDFYTGATPK